MRRRAVIWMLAGFALATSSAHSGEAAPPAVAPLGTLPMPPTPRSPVDYFRELLAMVPGDLERALAQKPEEHRRFLLAKLGEFQALKPEQRELRLRLLSLRWHLLPLMKTGPGDRAARLATISVADRPLIEKRLQQWDQLSPELQKEFLENENAVHYLLRLESIPAEQRRAILNDFPAEGRQKMEQELATWQSLPRENRERMWKSFQAFFELDPREMQKTLGILPGDEREGTERSLAAFRELSGDERERCIGAFRQFANMSPEERSEFLKNAERWQKMSPNEQRLWRELVHKLPPTPPLPPGFTNPSPVLLATNAVR